MPRRLYFSAVIHTDERVRVVHLTPHRIKSAGEHAACFAIAERAQ
jgi:hypothetical protein